ncbi:protein odr-4-like protein [Iris pallida]|uniref:Protein odr-4-like protein n=1 Tax=Iris pallida TaxID=29817 RepID=A0AAX6IH66_IRIPA|nr:protein odr-4-like protein [Iris pallida]
MVKSVIGEETQLKSLENRLFQTSIPAQVGIVVGKLNPNSDRAFVYDLIPTPPTDGGGPPCSLRSSEVGGGGGGREKKKKGGSSVEPPPSLSIDADWVAEHARQVSRMLMGGVHVVGVYVWASEASYKATSPSLLSQTVRGVAQAAPWYERESDERLLVHISYGPSRWVCRICTVASANMQPCDFKMGKLLSSLQTYQCMYNFEIRLPIFHAVALDSNTFKNVLRLGIDRHAKDLQTAKALIDAKLVTEDQHIHSEGLHKVELLLPFMRDVAPEACSSDNVAGLIIFTGAICASAYLGPKEPVAQAVSDIKADILKSLRSRLDIVCDEAEDKVELTSKIDMDASDDANKSIHQIILHQLRKPYSLHFPRRVLVPWLAGVFICDYLQPLESFEDLKDRCREMMSMESSIESSSILELEKEETTSLVAKSFWDVVCGDSANHLDESEDAKVSARKVDNGRSKTTSFNLVASIFVLLAALIVGWAITVLGSAKPAH